MAQKGAIISFEGGDASGKGTQSRLYYNYLEELGIPVRLSGFPRYDTATGELVAAYLNGEYGKDVHPELAGALYAFDRFYAKEEIKAWVDNGGIYLLDRYVDSNKGHQGGKLKTLEERIAFFDKTDEFEHVQLGLPRPAKTILFPIPPKLAQEYVDRKAKHTRTYTDKKRDIHEADSEHLRNANEAFLQLAEYEPDRIIVIDPVNEAQTALRPVEEIQIDVRRELKPLIDSLG